MLSDLNPFRKEGPIYFLESGSTFDYTDGRDTERYLESVLKAAGNLASDSPELEEAIQDWATEYHLSSRRANLLRPFDLGQCSTVLELGSGCGAITRFLGEQGLAVDAVEGSPARARLTALRCRDLDRVNVYCGNFNEMSLPASRYDLVLLVGVAEYAARFLGPESDRSRPVNSLLARLRPVLTPRGVIAIAIENRTGMKYVLGANEDHYAKPFVGINDYFGVRDINTYTLPEWKRILAEAGARDWRLYLPFPDYKLPTVLLSQQFAGENPNAFCNLEGVDSRDYVALFDPEVRESLFWQSASASGTLDAYSNSFMFLASFGDAGIARELRFDFAHLPGFGRKREYCLMAVKPEGVDEVKRRKLSGEHVSDNPSEYVTHRVIDEPYRSGVLLSVLWSRALEIEPESGRFVDLVKSYLGYLDSRAELSIDLTAANIVVDDDGVYHAFDEEWQVEEKVSPDFLLFRSLLILLVKSWGCATAYAEARNLRTVHEFITAVAREAGMDLAGSMDVFIAREERFQAAIAQRRVGDRTSDLLSKPVAEDRRLLVPVKMRVYWKTPGERFDEDRCRHAYVEEVDSVQVITVSLPPEATRATRFRFNPCEKAGPDGSGFMRIYSMQIRSVDPSTGERSTVWSLSGAGEIVKYTDMTRIEYAETGLGSSFMVTGDDPWFEFPFMPRNKLEGSEYLEFHAELRLARSKEYLLARDRYLAAEEEYQVKLRELHDKRAACDRDREELAGIKASKFWRLFSRYQRLRSAMQPLEEKARLWRALLRNLGPALTLRRAGTRIRRRAAALMGRTPEVTGPPTRYEVWRDKYLRRDAPGDGRGPLISVVMPVYNVEPRILNKAVASVRRQSYADWELCIADDASTNPRTREVLESLSDDRIKVRYLDANLNISGATNAAVELARGEYLAFMDNDDELEENALQVVAEAIRAGGADVLYTDEDFIRTDNHLDLPHFKPDYNPDLLLSHNYVTHLLVVSKSLFDQVGGLRDMYNGAQDYDLVLRLSETARNIVHVPRPLYHWRMSETSTSLNPTIKEAGHDNARKALQDAVRRRGMDAQVENTRLPHYFRVRRNISGSPLVSIVIPFRDKPGLLEHCVRTLISTTSYGNYEVVGISNDSSSSLTYDAMERLGGLGDRIRFHEVNIDFNFSRLVNEGVRKAEGEHVVLLNNDIEVASPDWIESLLEHSQRPEIAAVGGKLCYPNNTIQHAGIAVGLGGYAGHLHHRSRADSPGYFNRLNVVQNVTAVTGAMMMVEKRKYADLGMFDEEDFKIAYNDVDFCLRAVEAGYLNVYTPYAQAYHRESMSRGYEDTYEKQTRFEREKRNLRERHGEALRRGDPYYNPNFDQNRDNFSLPE